MMPELVWPLPNVWLGVSVENQRAAEERIVDLLETPAAIRFISCEPLLGPVDLYEIQQVLSSITKRKDIYLADSSKLDWVIVGGESGPKARPMDPDWVRDIRDQCLVANVPLFFKQWGEWQFVMKDYEPNHVMYERVGKKKAGRALDGMEWIEFPRESSPESKIKVTEEE